MLTVPPRSIAFAIALLFAATETAAQRPSFACDAAVTPSERMICSDASLASEDVLVARLHDAARRSAPLGRPGNGHVAAQRRWLAERAQCERRGPAATSADELRDCLRLAYRSRIVQLATAALFVERDLALGTLRQRDPGAAPLVEAVMLHAAHSARSDWTRAPLRSDRMRIVALLRAPFGALMRDPNGAVISALLKDEGVSSVEEALRSDARFALTIKLLAVHGNLAFAPLRIPCEALVRRPDLRTLEDPIFGSTRDDFVPTTDCADALPPMPRLEALAEAVRRRWPQCEGTIANAAYAVFAARLDDARLGVPRTEASSGDRRMPQRAGVSTPAVDAAIEQLTRQYETYRGYDAAVARATAHARVADLLGAAHSCG